MIGSIKRTKEILNKYKLRIKKRMGQNFLVDENILKKIIAVSGITKEDGIIEIGPGLGALTEYLLLAGKKVLAYEIDSTFVEVLQNELKDYSNLQVINEDFLKTDLNQEAAYFSDCARVLVVSNLPYYITTPIIGKLLSANSKIKEMYLLVQKEVGLRLAAEPGSKDYNSLSVFFAYNGKCAIEFAVSRNCFIPVPNVDSAVISIKRVESEIRANDESHFMKFVQVIFSQKRKTLLNNLCQGYLFSKEKIKEILAGLGFSANTRSEELTLAEIYEIYTSIFSSPK